MPAAASGIDPVIGDIGTFKQQPAQRAPARSLSSLGAILWVAGMVPWHRRQRHRL